MVRRARIAAVGKIQHGRFNRTWDDEPYEERNDDQQYLEHRCLLAQAYVPQLSGCGSPLLERSRRAVSRKGPDPSIYLSYRTASPGLGRMLMSVQGAGPTFSYIFPMWEARFCAQFCLAASIPPLGSGQGSEGGHGGHAWITLRLPSYGARRLSGADERMRWSTPSLLLGALGAPTCP